MTTAADIIKQYGRVLAHDTIPGEIKYPDFESDMMTIGLIVSNYGNTPIPHNEAEAIRDNIGICLAGQDHWWWNCDEHNCSEADQ